MIFRVILAFAIVLFFSTTVSARSSAYYDSNDSSEVGIQKRKHFCIAFICPRGAKTYQLDEELYEQQKTNEENHLQQIEELQPQQFEAKLPLEEIDQN